MLDPRHQEGFDFLILSLCSVSDRAGGPREASGRKQDASAQCGASLGRAISFYRSVQFELRHALLISLFAGHLQ